MGQEAHKNSGYGFYMKQALIYKTRRDREVNFCDEFTKFRSTWLEILNDNKQPNMAVGVYYRHPRNIQMIYLILDLRGLYERFKMIIKSTSFAGTLIIIFLKTNTINMPVGL